MKFEIKAYNLQELGQRQNQEDSLYPALGQSTNDDRLFILCDGMGGHEKGEVASATVCETMSKTILSMWDPTQPLTDDMFQKALDAAYDALDAKDHGEERKMGTTMTFVCLHADGVTVAHIGDSRIYQLRPAANGQPASIVFRTQDHSLVNDLVRVGEITEEEAKHHPQKNVITRAMQPCQERRAKADITHLTDIQPGDYFYMCSDGMLEEATDENILNIITMPDKTDEEKLEMLRKVTEENKDNHTAHLIRINKVEGAVVSPPAVEAEQGPKGTLITPDEEPQEAQTCNPPAIVAPGLPSASQPKPKKKLLTRLLIVGAVVIAAISIAGVYFMPLRKSDKSAASGKETVKVEVNENTPSPQNADGKPNGRKTSNVAAAAQDKAGAKNNTATAEPTFMNEIKGWLKGLTESVGLNQEDTTQQQSTPTEGETQN
jgi:PPM family protein phosphatase